MTTGNFYRGPVRHPNTNPFAHPVALDTHRARLHVSPYSRCLDCGFAGGIYKAACLKDCWALYDAEHLQAHPDCSQAQKASIKKPLEGTDGK